MLSLKKQISYLSVTKWYDPFLNIFSAVTGFFILSKSGFRDSFAVLVIILMVTLVAFLKECLASQWFKAYFLEKNRLPKVEQDFWRKVFIKWIGVLGGMLLVLFSLWLLPDYRLPKYALPLSEVKYMVAIFIVFSSFLLISVTDRILGSAEDRLYKFGKSITNRNLVRDFSEVKNAVLEFILRAFFLILNYTTAVSMFTRLKAINFSILLQTPLNQSITTWLDLLFLILLFTILPGYFFSARLLSTQVRDLDRTLFGWVVTFICYPPLIYSVFGAWLEYKVNIAQLGEDPWINILQNAPIAFMVCASIIIFSELIHLWGESILGIRSSNLMNRGIVTNGPFAYTKHPIYVVKCIGWFFIFLPFMSPVGFFPTVQTCVLFLMVCGIFAMRSWAEERLLAKDENYVVYAKYIDSKGVFRFINKLLPFMSFSWRYEYWKNRGLLEI